MIEIDIRAPESRDGAEVHHLIAACPPLDTNSLYANLLQCSDFAATCALARRDGRVVGWVSGYRLPDQPQTYFLWQVAVAAEMRGQSLPRRLLHHILSRRACAGVRQLQTTITADNTASWRLFEALARRAGAPLSRQDDWFDRETHFHGDHAGETLVTIGPFACSGSLSPFG